MPAKKVTDKKNDLSFEQALERLNTIADILENQNPALDEALSLYEESAALLKESMEKLKHAETKITLVKKESSILKY